MDITIDDNRNVYVVSDIHNYADGFKRLLKKIRFNENDLLIIDGDIFDRGDKPVELYFEILKYPNIQVIQGNHDVWVARQIIEQFGHRKSGEYISYNDLKYIKKQLLLEIKYSDNKKDLIKLSIKKDFTNSLLLYIKKEESVDNKDADYESGLLMKEIDSKMKEYGTKEDYYYTYERNVDGKKVIFLYSNYDLTVTIDYENIMEVWNYSFSKKNIITYTKVINEKIKEEKMIKYKNPAELSKKERKIYEKAIENVQKYLAK